MPSVTSDSPIVSDPFAAEQGTAIVSNIICEDHGIETLIQHLSELDGMFSCIPVTGQVPVLVEPNQIRIGDDNLALTHEGWDQLATHCRAPSSYWGKIGPDFRSEIAQHHIDHLDALTPRNSSGALEAIAFQKCFVGFRPIHLIHLNFTTIARAILAGLGDDARFFTVNRLQMTDDSVFVELRTSRRTRAVQRGDIVQGGIAFSHSLLGTTPTTVDLFIFRQVCSNGMALRHCVGHSAISRSRRLKRTEGQSSTTASEQIQRMTQERMSHLDELLSSLGKLPDTRIENDVGIDDEETMRRFLMPPLRATHVWSDHLWDNVIAKAWRHDLGGKGELHEFAAVNTITYVATHQRDLSFRQRRTLARLAGLLAFRRVHICPRCHTAVVES